ncbi:Heterotrimeric G-protein alpha subunit 4 [Mycena chlorophos]|uniref:Heterotrimeric G-protein alpha subunit 4 n=1 Tax=Mycena chlorophos TaxID=658473 RepID=A0A8H6TPT0_MYCCL|nr:Heterotrimeric G-protein alpha subunit 4 [Mycena chlorophos]
MVTNARTLSRSRPNNAADSSVSSETMSLDLAWLCCLRNRAAAEPWIGDFNCTESSEKYLIALDPLPYGFPFNLELIRRKFPVSDNRKRERRIDFAVEIEFRARKDVREPMPVRTHAPALPFPSQNKGARVALEGSTDDCANTATMGACFSQEAAEGAGVTEVDRALHRAAEKELRIAKNRMAHQAKVLLLGAGESGKSTIQKQMRLIHNVPFSDQETEHFRQLVFDNLGRGILAVIEALPDMGLELIPGRGEDEEGGGPRTSVAGSDAAYSPGCVYPESDPEGRGGFVKGWAPGECGGEEIAKVWRERQAEARAARSGPSSSFDDSDSPRMGLDDAQCDDDKGVTPDRLAADVALIENTPDLRAGQPFPLAYLGAVLRLWDEPIVREAWTRANEVALPENLPYLISSIPRLFSSSYVPTSSDILRTRARTIGITETAFKVGTEELLMVDVGGQKTERRKWIHSFSDVTSVLFLVSLSGYDQCLVEDRGANQMEDAMTIWDSICHSMWFRRTSLILFLNKDDLYQKKIHGGKSPIKNYFPDYDADPLSATAGREYFKRRFGRIAHKASTMASARAGTAGSAPAAGSASLGGATSPLAAATEKERERDDMKKRSLYTHVTNATDTEMVRLVMAAVEDMILRANLQGAAMI